MDKIIKNLKKYAEKSNMNNKHSACVVTANNMIYGINRYYKESSIHAESNVLWKIRNSCKKIDMYVIRIKNNGTLKYSRPCDSCIDLLRKRGVRKVYYSNHHGHLVYEYTDIMQKCHISSGFRHKK